MKPPRRSPAVAGGEPAERVLHLHLGHHKTGSSFLQSCFAASAKALQRHGILYPGADRQQHAAEGGISTGNGGPLVAFSRDGAERTAFPDLGRRFSVLFSNEALMRSYLTPGALHRLAVAAREAGAARIRMLLFIHDPVSHCASMYQQAVKRGGMTMGVDAFAERYVVPVQVENFIKACAVEPDIDLTIRNYSVLRRDLRRSVTDWLGVPDDTLQAPAIATVNRSLTRAEMQMQIVLNGLFGRCGELLSDPLCEGLPEMRADEVRPSLAAQERLWARLETVIGRINDRLNPAHRYRRDVDAEEPPAPASLGLTPDQLRIAAASLGAEIARLRMRLSGELDLLDRLIATQGNTSATRRFVLDLARSRDQAGDRTGAIDALRRLLAIAPDCVPALRALRSYDEAPATGA